MNFGMSAITSSLAKEGCEVKQVYLLPPMRIIRITLVVAIMDFITTIFLTLGIEGFSWKDWFYRELKHYSFVHSSIDIQVLCFIRIALIAVTCKKAMQGSVMVQLDGKVIHERYSTMTFKLCTSCAAICLTKAIIAVVEPEGAMLAWVPAFLNFFMCLSECWCIWVLWATISRCARSNLYEKLLSESEDIREPLRKREHVFVQFFHVLKPYFWPGKTETDYILNRIRAVSTVFMVLGSKVLGVIAPLYLGNAANALVYGDYNGCITGIILYSAISVSSKLLKEFQNIVYLRVKQAAYVELALTSFRHIHRLSLQWHLKKKIGHIMRSMDRGNTAADNIVSYLFLVLVPCLLEIAMTVLVFFTKFSDWKLGVMVIFALWLYGFATVKLTLWRMRFRQETNVHDNMYHDKAADSIINFETVKYFTNEENECEWFKDSVVKFIFCSTNVQVSLAIINMVQATIMGATICAGLVLAAGSIQEGLYEVGDLLTINVYLTNVFIPLNFLGTVYNIIVQAFVDIESLSDLLAEYPDVVDDPDAKDLELPPPGAISGIPVEFRNVSFHYPGQPLERGLKDINIIVPPGGTTALVGSTGSGKTTLSRLMFRFYDPVEGSVLLNGQDVSMLKQKSSRGAIGVVPQIRYGCPDASMAEITKAAEDAQILDFILTLPEQWDTKVGERGLKLSGGEKQRVAIARCLLKNPPVVLLDEATSALDSITEASIQQALFSLSANRTSVIIAHRLSTIRHADQIIVLDMGRIVERGNHTDLMEQKGAYHDMWNMQLSEDGER